jgi:hypothetical protein
MIEHLRHAELVLRLFEVLRIIRAADWDDLKRVLFCVGAATNVEYLAMSPAAQFTEDLELADMFRFHVAAESRGAG